MQVTEVEGKYRVEATTEELKRFLSYGDVSPEGIIFNWELAGPHGADYFIFPADHHTKEDVENTKNWLRNNHDVVSLIVGHPIGDYPIPREHETWTPEQREAGFRKIVAERQFGIVENCIGVDLTTAHVVVQVMDALSPENKAKFLQFDALRMTEIAWKLVE